MRFKLTSLKEKGENEINIDVSSLNINTNENIIQKEYILETFNQALIKLVKLSAISKNNHSEENQKERVISFEILGEVYSELPRLSCDDFKAIEKIKEMGVNAVNDINKAQSSNSDELVKPSKFLKELSENMDNYQNAWNYLDYLENNHKNIVSLNLSSNDVDILFAVLNAANSKDVGKIIHVEINEEKTKQEIIKLDELQKNILSLNSNSRIHNQCEKAKFNIMNITNKLINQYNEQMFYFKKQDNSIDSLETTDYIKAN